MSTMERILRLMNEKRASDIYLSANAPALIKINGQCVPINGQILPSDAPRNLLAEVWGEKPTSELFPPSVWYMLTEPAFSNSGQTALAHNTRQRWQHYGQLARPESKQGKALATLLFGAGGQYSADQLTVRANMLNELQSAVRLLNQELQGLLLALNEE